MSEFKYYRRTQLSEARPYVEGEDMTNISVSSVDHNAGSPKVGDMIARNPLKHQDKWLIARAYFDVNFVLLVGEIDAEGIAAP
jgi:hypothetical protein